MNRLKHVFPYWAALSLSFRRISINDIIAWGPQVSISKTNRIVCWIVRNLIIREKSVMIAIYKAFHIAMCLRVLRDKFHK